MKASSITNKRGFVLDNYPYSLSFVLIKAGIDNVGVILADLLEKTVIKDVYRNFDRVDGNWLLWQYAISKINSP